MLLEIIGGLHTYIYVIDNGKETNFNLYLLPFVPYINMDLDDQEMSLSPIYLDYYV